ncbi:hypothetical protein CRENBAI_019547 [Crenichthys baileyi]|uniref:Uncharacterized protein n=1 Tax=Crenichthys baileyi TaxID=28760 RepID=A0AAV9QZK5_9TELE
MRSSRRDGTLHEEARWIQHQEDARAFYGEEIEILPSPLLLEEIEEVFGGSCLVLVSPGYEPGQNRTTSTPPTPMSSSSRRRHLLSTPAAAAAQFSCPQRPLLSSHALVLLQTRRAIHIHSGCSRAIHVHSGSSRAIHVHSGSSRAIHVHSGLSHRRVSCWLFLSAGTPPPSELRPALGPDLAFQ